MKLEKSVLAACNTVFEQLGEKFESKFSPSLLNGPTNFEGNRILINKPSLESNLNQKTFLCEANFLLIPYWIFLKEYRYDEKRYIVNQIIPPNGQKACYHDFFDASVAFNLGLTDDEFNAGYEENDETKRWYKGHLVHREDGPAIINKKLAPNIGYNMEYIIEKMVPRSQFRVVLNNGQYMVNYTGPMDLQKQILPNQK